VEQGAGRFYTILTYTGLPVTFDRKKGFFKGSNLKIKGFLKVILDPYRRYMAHKLLIYIAEFSILYQEWCPQYRDVKNSILWVNGRRASAKIRDICAYI